MNRGLPPGTTLRRSPDAALPLDYFIYVPHSGVRDGRVLVTVHGISRNAEQHITGFADCAERYGAAIVAPLFTRKEHRRYQRLGRSAREERADLAFDRVLADATERLGIEPCPLHLFGFSGGGQFAHRYALFNPRRVARQVLGAPGWYTFPDPDQHYPLGMRSSADWPRLRFNPARFLRIPTLVLVGENDTARDRDLNRTRQIDALQGLTRMERGIRWTAAMSGLAHAYDLDNRLLFEVLPTADHAFDSYLAQPEFSERIFTFLFGEESG